MNCGMKFAIAIILAATFCLPVLGQTQSAREVLDQYISDLQKNPGDTVLREKLIKHVQTMAKAPAIQEQVRKYLNRGMAAAEDAKNEQDFRDAAEEFKKAVNLAPWLGTGYRGLAVTQDKSGQYSQALQNLKFFLLTNPSATDAEAARALMDKIEYRMEKAAKESSPEAIAAKKQQEYELWLRKLDGARYAGQSSFGQDLRWDNELAIRGKTLIWKQRIIYAAPDVILDIPVGTWYEMGQMRIDGRRAENHNVPALPDYVGNILTISEDGNSILVADQTVNGPTWTFYRQ